MRRFPVNGQIAVVLVLLVVLIAPWYVCKLLAIHHGDEPTSTAFLLRNIHQGRNLWERLLHAGGLLHNAIPLPAIAALLAAMALALRDPVQRRLTLLVTAPFALLWALGFSYDLRNVALALPFAAAAAGIGAVEMGRKGIGDWGLGIRARTRRGTRGGLSPLDLSRTYIQGPSFASGEGWGEGNRRRVRRSTLDPSATSPPPGSLPKKEGDYAFGCGKDFSLCKLAGSPCWPSLRWRSWA